MNSKCPPKAQTQARRRRRHSSTARLITALLAVDASFQLVDVRSYNIYNVLHSVI